jgi:hypothetical protein
MTEVATQAVMVSAGKGASSGAEALWARAEDGCLAATELH